MVLDRFIDASSPPNETQNVDMSVLQKVDNSSLPLNIDYKDSVSSSDEEIYNDYDKFQKVYFVVFY